MVHQPAVLLEPRGDVVGVVGPADAAEVGHPARDGDVAQVAAAVDEGGVGEHDRQQAEVQVVVGHLVDDRGRPGRRRARAAARGAARPACGGPRPSRCGTQSMRRAGPARARRGWPRRSAGPAAARRRRGSASGWPGPARSASCPSAAGRRRRPAGASRGPARQSGRRSSASKARIRPSTNRSCSAGTYSRLPLGQLQAEGVGLAEALGGAGVVAAGVEHVGQAEEEPGARAAGQVGVGQPGLERGEVVVGQLAAEQGRQPGVGQRRSCGCSRSAARKAASASSIRPAPR